MERAVAVRKLGKLIGKGFGYRIDSKAPTPEERAAAKTELITVGAERDALERKRNERRRAILAADAEYQSLCAAYDVAQKRAANLLGMTYRSRFTVGVTNGMFFVVKADGDSWEEVINKIESRA